MSLEESQSQMWNSPNQAGDFSGNVDGGSTEPNIQVHYYSNNQPPSNQHFYSKSGSQQFDPSRSSSGSLAESASSQSISSQMEYLESQEAVMALQDFMENTPSNSQNSMPGSVSMDYQNTNKSVFSQASRQMEQKHVDGNSSHHGGSVVAALLQQKSPNSFLETSGVKTAECSTGRAGQTNQMSGLSQVNQMNSMSSQHEQHQQMLRASVNHSENVHSQNIHSYNQNQQIMYTQNEQNVQSNQVRHPGNKSAQSLNQNMPYQNQPGQVQHSNMVSFQHQMHNTHTYQPQGQQSLHSSNVNPRGLESAGMNVNYHQKQRQQSLNMNHSYINQTQGAEALVPSNRSKSSFSPAEPSPSVQPKSKMENILARGQGNETGVSSHFHQTDYSDTCESPMQNGPYFDSNNSNIRMATMHNMNSPIQHNARYSYSQASNVPTRLQYHRQPYEQFSPNSSYSPGEVPYGSQTLDYQSNRQSFSDNSLSGSSPSYKHAQYVQSNQSLGGVQQSTITNENQKCVNYAQQNQYAKHSKNLPTGQMQLKDTVTGHSKVFSNLKVLGGSLQKDMVYSIKSSTGKRICASWNGETFETVDQSSKCSIKGDI